jgi:hypothetical protein
MSLCVYVSRNDSELTDGFPWNVVLKSFHLYLRNVYFISIKVKVKITLLQVVEAPRVVRG